MLDEHNYCIRNWAHRFLCGLDQSVLRYETHHNTLSFAACYNTNKCYNTFRTKWVVCSTFVFHLQYFRLLTSQNSRFLDKIALNIPRVSSAKGYCVFPACKQTKGLCRLPNHMRYNIAVKQKLYVPAVSVVCADHLFFEAWTGVSDLRTHTWDSPMLKPSYKYSKDQIEDIFALLTNTGLIFNSQSV